MSRRPRESESESESEAEAPLRLDEPLAEEGLQDIDFDFDDPQERHAPSILGLLRKHPLADVAPRPALAALADLLAGDPRSVGTVVGSGGGDDLIGSVAAVDLAAYDAGAHAGVDAVRACLGALALRLEDLRLLLVRIRSAVVGQRPPPLKLVVGLREVGAQRLVLQSEASRLLLEDGDAVEAAEEGPACPVSSSRSSSEGK